MNLHGQIMNLPCNELHAGSPKQEVQRAYGEGHKRARRAAAELANEADAEIERLREALQTIRLATCDYTTGTRASLEAANKLATNALKTPNAELRGDGPASPARRPA